MTPNQETKKQIIKATVLHGAKNGKPTLMGTAVTCCPACNSDLKLELHCAGGKEQFDWTYAAEVLVEAINNKSQRGDDILSLISKEEADEVRKVFREYYGCNFNSNMHVELFSLFVIFGKKIGQIETIMKEKP